MTSSRVGPEAALQTRWCARLPCVAGVLALTALAQDRSPAQELEPLIYTLRFPTPEQHSFDVDVVVPSEKHETVELMMAVWSPGYYDVGDYAKQITGFAAKSPDGALLSFDHAVPNHWTVHTGGRTQVVVSYTLAASRGSVITNSVDEGLAVITGPATYITLAERAHRPAEVRLEMPKGWKSSATALAAARDGQPNHYSAPDYDALADCPILAGTLSVHEFEVAHVRHYLVDAGNLGAWDGAKGAQQLAKMVEEQHHFWGFLPYEKYVFLNVFRQGGGGLEHSNSCLLTSSARQASNPESYFSWAAYVSHEYFHALNVKRLRPIELGPFDYEHPPVTTGLWVAEGLTTYYGELLAVRAGLGTQLDFWRTYSGHVGKLQNTPGRLVQTLLQSSSQIFDSGGSGVGGNDANTVSYYVKGPIVGLLLDAHIRRLTDSKRSLDDVMRLEYARYSGEHGFTEDQFDQTASDAAGVDLASWLHKALATTEELDYTEMLEWYGLRFASSAPEPKAKWTIEVLPDATDAQQAHLAALFAASNSKQQQSK